MTALKVERQHSSVCWCLDAAAAGYCQAHVCFSGDSSSDAVGLCPAGSVSAAW